MKTRRVPIGDLSLLEMPIFRADNLLELERLVDGVYKSNFDTFLDGLVAALRNRTDCSIADINLTITHHSTLTLGSPIDGSTHPNAVSACNPITQFSLDNGPIYPGKEKDDPS